MNNTQKKTFLKHELLNYDDVSLMLGISRTTLYRMVTKGTFPQPIKISRQTVRWTKEDVNEWKRKTKGRL